MGLNLFQKGMCAANDDLSVACGEKFTVLKNGNAGQYDAISISRASKSIRNMAGGKFVDATLSLLVKDWVFDAAGIANGTVLAVGDDTVRVMTFQTPRDGSKRLICGPVSIQAPRP